MNKLTHDLTGQVFGDWIVLEKTIGPVYGSTKFNCQCVCGTLRAVTSRNLRLGSSLGCGCKRAERVSQKKIRHGQSIGGKKTQLYNAWNGIKQRTDSNAWIKYPAYTNIRMYQPWRESFEQFKNDVGDPPAKKLCLDRIDGTKDYEPGNVRWVDYKTNNRNKSTVLWIEYQGKRKALSEWCEIFELPYNTIHARITRYNMTPADALTKPLKDYHTHQKNK